jgi:uncharacterized Tic20 family protein
LWGLIVPLTIWVTQKDRSLYLRFQGLQATVYQTLATAGYFVFLAVSTILTVAMLTALIQLPDAMDGTEENSSILIGLLVVLALNLLLLIVFALAVPTYHLFALIAGIQILKGRDYRYPWLGNFIARRMKLDSSPKE